MGQAESTPAAGDPVEGGDTWPDLSQLTAQIAGKPECEGTAEHDQRTISLPINCKACVSRFTLPSSCTCILPCGFTSAHTAAAAKRTKCAEVCECGQGLVY